MNRVAAVLNARLKEFYRDKSGLSWNLLMPFLILIGFAALFSGDPREVLTVGVLTDELAESLVLPGTRVVRVDDRQKGVLQVQRHQLDLLIEPGRYWSNKLAEKSLIAEKLLLTREAETNPAFRRENAEGAAVRYVDWLMPGVLSMNIMFSCLWGVGWVVVRYRKNGVLRRLQATPLTALEFLSAQVIARLLIVSVATTIVFSGSAMLVGFVMRGSYLALILVFLLGSMCLTSIGLLIAARLRTEEVADGVLNLLSWPMMMMSGVWFSMENAHPVAQAVSRIFPLTHMIEAARRIMLDAADISGVAGELMILTLTTVILMLVAARLFRWQ